MDRLVIELDTRAVEPLFKRLLALGADMTPLMRKAAGHLEDQTEQAFEDEASPEGVPWPALASATIAARERSGYWPGKKLQVEGQLAASYGSDYGEDFAQIGSNKVYAAIHQAGGRAGRGRRVQIPARPVLGLAPETVQAILLDARTMLAHAAR